QSRPGAGGRERHRGRAAPLPRLLHRVRGPHRTRSPGRPRLTGGTTPMPLEGTSRLALFGLAGILLAGACGPHPPARTPAPSPSRPAPAPGGPAPYAYPAPVKGHYKEINTGDFDLVDGISYAAGEGTVVLATEKPIASPILAGSICPMTQARAIALIRNAGYL